MRMRGARELVARIERSEIREGREAISIHSPDVASLHPGYDDLSAESFPAAG
jgi:hypothetical protein